MGFLKENNSQAYFAILGELSSGLSFTMGFFKTKCSLISWPFQGARKDILRNTLMFQLDYEDQISEEKFFCFLH